MGALLGWQGLWHQPGRHTQDRDTEAGQEHEDNVPVTQKQELTAYQRRDYRGKARDSRLGRIETRSILAGGNVTDERIIDNEAGGGREAEHIAGENHPSDIGGQQTSNRGEDEDRHCDQKWSAATKRIDQRADEKLTRSHAKQACGDGELHHCVGGVQIEH